MKLIGGQNFDSMRDVTLRNTIAQIVHQADEQKLPHLLIGGHAVLLYGVTRFTRDCDFLIPETHADVWNVFLTQKFGYRVFQSSQSFLRFENDALHWMPIDFALVDLQTWEKLLSRAQTRSLVEGVQVFLPHPIHLIAMKLFALASPHRRKDNVDLSDIVQLMVEQKLSLDDSEILAVIRRYGSDEILQKIKTACEGIE